MAESFGSHEHQERHIDALIAEYYQALENGTPLNHDEFVSRNPEFAAEIEAFLDDVERFESFARPVVSQHDSSPVLSHIASPVLEYGAIVRYFGNYQILHELGNGGMGVVYKARQTTLRRIVALKIVRSVHMASESDLQRFQSEAQAAAKLNHPSIVAVHEVGVVQGQPFYAMDYVDGGSLSQLHRDGPIASRRAADLVRLLAEAMHHAHERGIVHRDLKPANILLTSAGLPRIADFGLAKRLWKEPGSVDVTITETGQILGTAGYMSPEQAAGMSREVGAATDIYALGAVLYSLLTGRAPFLGETVAHTIFQVLHHEPVPPRSLNPDIPRDLETVCLRCLEKNSHQRYATAQSLADDLARFLSDRPVAARPIGFFSKCVRWSRRNPWTATSLGLLVLFAFASLLFAMFYHRIADERLLASQRTERALKGERSARESTLQQLYFTNLERAKATRLSGRPGQRLAALEAIRTSSELFAKLGLSEDDRRQLRDQAIGAFTLMDARKVHSWEGALSTATDVALNHTLEKLVHGLPGQDSVEVRRLSAMSNNGPRIATKIVPNNSFFQISRNDRWVSSYQATSQSVQLLSLAQMREAGQRAEVCDLHSVDFHPFRDQAAIGLASGRVEIIDLNTLDAKLLPAVEGAPIVSARYSPDGERLALCRSSGLIEIRSSANGQLEQRLEVGLGTREIAWHPGGQQLAMGVGQDVRLYPLRPEFGWGASVICRGHQAGIMYVGWHPTLPVVASSAHDGITSFWDARTGRRLISLPGQFKGFNDAGTQVALRLPRGVEIWELVLPELISWPDRRPSRSLAIHPNGRLIAIAQGPGVALWDLGREQQLAMLPLSQTDGLAFHPQAGHLLSSGAAGLWKWPVSSTPANSDSTLKIGPPVRLVHGETFRGTLSQSGDGRFTLVAGGGSQGSLLLDRFDKQIRLATPATPTLVRMTLSPDGHWAVGGEATGEKINVWELPSGRLQHVLPVVGGMPYAQFSPDGKWFAANGLESVSIWKVVDWTLLHNIPLGSYGIAALAFSPDSTKLVVGRCGSSLQMLDVETARLVANFETTDQPLTVFDMAFTPDGTHLIGTLDQQGFCCWNLGAMRHRLTEVGLAWNEALPPSVSRAATDTIMRLEVDLGTFKPTK